jgi:hypothetical protein
MGQSEWRSSINERIANNIFQSRSDGLDDYLVLNPVTGALTAFINLGSNSNIRWSSTGVIANGRGPGANVRIADIDGDGVSSIILI